MSRRQSHAYEFKSIITFAANHISARTDKAMVVVDNLQFDFSDV